RRTRGARGFPPPLPVPFRHPWALPHPAPCLCRGHDGDADASHPSPSPVRRPPPVRESQGILPLLPLAPAAVRRTSSTSLLRTSAPMTVARARRTLGSPHRTLGRSAWVQ